MGKRLFRAFLFRARAFASALFRGVGTAATPTVTRYSTWDVPTRSATWDVPARIAEWDVPSSTSTWSQ